MSEIHQSVRAVRQDGGRWVERLATDNSDSCREEFNAWISQSPLHIEAYLFAKTVAELLKVGDPDRRIAFADLQTELNVTSLRDIHPITWKSTGLTATPDLSPPSNAPGHRAHSSRRLISLWSIPAILAAVCGFIWLCLQYFGDLAYSTGLGEQRTIRLEDGSIVDLNTQTRIEVEFSRRNRTVKLLYGEAAFRVAHNSKRPFRVISEDAVIQAVGTEFSVYRHDASTRVAVIEGRVAVAPTATDAQADRPPTLDGPAVAKGLHVAELLNAGEEADMSRSGHFVRASRPDVAGDVSWRQRRLSFDDQPLSTVVAEFRRYSDYKITLDGDALKQRRVRGVFHSDRPESLVEFLELDRTLQVEHVADGVVVHPR